MKKTFKEKYYELKKEKDYLQFIFDCKCIDYNNLKIEFDDFKLEIKKEKEKADKQSFIIFLIGLGILSVFALVGTIFTALGLM